MKATPPPGKPAVHCGFCGMPFNADQDWRRKRIADKARDIRREALEEAAQKAETFFDWCKPIGEHGNMALAQEFGKECAKAIRALMEKDAKKSETVK